MHTMSQTEFQHKLLIQTFSNTPFLANFKDAFMTADKAGMYMTCSVNKTIVPLHRDNTFYPLLIASVYYDSHCILKSICS